MDGKNGRDAIMKYSKITLVLAAFAATACAIEVLPETPAENQPEVQLYPMTFTAGADDGSDSETKVTLDGTSVLWAADDQIKVFDGTATPLPAFTIANGAGKTSATFSGSVADPSAKTYYALYPYQETATFTSGNITIGKNPYTSYLTVDLPEEQQAVDGSVDPKAFLALAFSDGNGDFSFKNLNSLVKFRLSESDITKLESISISSNSLEAIAGNMKVAFNANGVPVQTYVSGKMDSYITLKAPTEGFKANTDYFIAIRSIGFASGLTITAKYEGGTCKHATSTKAPEKSLSRNSVLNLGTLPLVKGLPNNLYIAYLHGQDIDIAGTKVNKTTHPDAHFITAESENKEIGNSGVYFIDPNVPDVTIAAGMLNTIVTSNTEARATVSRAGQLTVKATENQDYFYMYNVKYVTGMSAASGNMLAAIGDDAKTFVFETISFDNCEFELPKDYNFMYSQYNIASFSMVDCDIKLHANTKDKITETNILSTNTNNATAYALTFKNNIFYCTEGDVTNFQVFKNNNATVSSAEIRKNTFAKVYAKATNGYFAAKHIATANVVSNLFYLPDYATLVLDKYTGILYATDKDAAGFTIKSNLACYDGAVPTQRLKANYYANDASGELYNKTDNPFTTADFTNGVFTQTETYKSYGAQRPQAGAQSLSARQTWSGVSEWN